ncbi:LysR family transcriptional regulator ArgP [Colwelliaceae bacterium 6471]
MRPLDYKLIHAFDVVLNEQSFDKAADKLNITQSAVSQRIKQLEQFVSQPVLIRGTPLAATSVGEKLLQHFRQVRQLEYDLIKHILPEEAESTVQISIAVNADTLASWFIPALTPLLKKYPIALKLQVCDETRTKNLLKKGEVFAALSSQSESFTGCKVQEVGLVDYILCATPDFKARYFAKGLNQQTLKRAPSVEYDQQDTMHSDYIESYFHLKAADYPSHVVRSSEAFVTMALAGVAYCLLPHTQANEYLADGRLVDLAPKHHLQRNLYWHSWVLERGLHKKVSQSLVEFGRNLLNYKMT